MGIIAESTLISHSKQTKWTKKAPKWVNCVTFSFTWLYKTGLNRGDRDSFPSSSEVKDNRRPYDLDYSCLWERKLTNVVISRKTAGLHSLLFLLLPFSVYSPSLTFPPQTSNYIMLFFFFNPSGLSFAYAICPPCPNSDTQIFKSCLAFDYQMKEDYSWIVVIMPDKLLHTQKRFSKFASIFRLWRINRRVVLILLDVKSFYHLVPSKIKSKISFIDPGFLPCITDFTSGRKTWTNYLNHSFHSVFIVICLAHLFSPSCERVQELGEWKANEGQFLLFKLLRLCAADVPLSKEFNTVITAEKAFKKAKQHPWHNVCNDVNVKKGQESSCAQ